MEGKKLLYTNRFSIEGTPITWLFYRQFTRQLTPEQLEKLSCGQDCRLFDQRASRSHSATQIEMVNGYVTFASVTENSSFEIKLNYQDAKDALLKFREAINFDNSTRVKEFSYIYPYLTVMHSKDPEAKQWRLEHNCAKQIEYYPDSKRIKSFAIATGEDDEPGDWLHFRILDDEIEMEVNNYIYYFDVKTFMVTMIKIAEDKER